MEQLNKRLEVKGLSKTFFGEKGYFTAIDEVSLDVYDGEFLVILGPGRCGKTVLLNIISGLEEATQGQIIYNGKEWKGINPEIGMVFQKLALMPFKTVIQNVELALKFRGMDKEKRREIARYYIELVGLKGFEDYYPKQLSGGMQQRVGIARAYAADPKLLIMDEPFGKLDAQTRYQMQEDLLKIWEKEKRTIIFVTNNIEEACYLGDRIILLSDCPARVKEVYPIDLPRPRDMVSKEFLELRTVIIRIYLFSEYEVQRKETAMPVEDNRPIKVEVKNLTKRFGDLLVLDNMSFNIRKGEFVCVVGPTGCGKSTFLNCLTRIHMPSEGDLFIDGVPADPRKHNISFVFQEPSALPWMTVEENIAYGLKIKMLPKDEIDERVNQILDLMGLQEFRKSYPGELSVSAEQRIIIGRSFAMRPDLLLMDEPYGQMDVKMRFYLEDEVIRLWKELGSTVIFITHNIEEAVYLAEKVMILTNKPAKIKEEVIIDLPRPRDITSPKFIEYRNYITDKIKWW